MEHINIDDKIEELDNHIENNPRTILSAKFGDGKTCFLNEYIKQRSDRYFFVKLCPINYTVASNEDVFEYIKRDLLKQLCLYHLVDKHVLKNVMHALINVPNAVATLDFVTNVLLAQMPIPVNTDGLLKQCYNNFQKRYQSLCQYNETFTEQRGGIYEEDGYTLMIREALKKLQTRKRHPKKTVLIIDDLDRIDPGHLFRILNVLGAHLDTETASNKFGFNHIIVVLDYVVTEHIFHHFYGENANYEGYMEKFISSCICNYSIAVEAQKRLFQKIHQETDSSILNVVVALKDSRWDVTLRQRLEQKSIRHIVQIYDNLTQGMMPSVCTLYGHKIKSDTPLTYLIALLVLLNESYNRSTISKFFNKSNIDEILSLLGGFVYATEHIDKKRIMFQGNMYSVIPERQDEIIVSCRKIKEEGRNCDVVQMDDVIRNAFIMAQHVVRDGDGLRLYV